MASKHTLEGLIKWSMRDQWADRFERILEGHLMPACEETGLEIDDVVSAIGEDLFMSTVWACAFEDFLTHEFDDGDEACDDGGSPPGAEGDIRSEEWSLQGTPRFAGASATPPASTPTCGRET